MNPLSSSKPKPKEPLILSGQKASIQWIADIKTSIERGLSDKILLRPPGLGILQVGSLAASAAYIQQKLKAAQSCGMHTRFSQLSNQATEKELWSELTSLINDPLIDGVITQLPFDFENGNQRTFDGGLTLSQFTQKVLDSIPPHKDADGLHALNQGRLMSGESTVFNWTSPLPATPFGIMKLLEVNDIPLKSVDAVVIGKSRLVGTPIALMLSQSGATVTLCHKKTIHVAEKCVKAQIVIVAAGVQHLVKTEWVNSESVLVDVGIHRTPHGKLTGDVDPECYKVIKAYSPVPGGVGPMTVAALLQNVVNICLKK